MRYLFVLFLTIIIGSCSTDTFDIVTGGDSNESEDATPTAQDSVPLLTKITSTVDNETADYAFDLTDYSSTYSLNGNRTIDSFEIDLLRESTTREFETDSVRITKYTNTSFDLEQQTSSIGRSLFTYNSMGQIITITSFFNGRKYDEYVLEYDGHTITFKDQLDNRDKIITVDNNGNLKTFRLVNSDLLIEFDYANGNLIKKTLNGTTKVHYTYDDGKNPFKTRAFLNFSTIRTYLSVAGSSQSLFYDENNLFANTNNIISLTVENDVFNVLRNHHFQYEYNSENYPIKKTNIEGSFTTEYTYSID